MRWPKLPPSAALRGTLTFAGLLGAAGLVLVLAIQHRSLREQVRHLERKRRALHEGVVVPAFRTTTLAGDSVLIGDPPAGMRQLLMILNTRYPYCLATLPYWNEIVHRVRQRGTAVEPYAVSLDPGSVTAAYILKHGFDVPTIRFPDERTALVYRAIGVPITVVISEGGRVLYGRAGDISRQRTVDSIYLALGIEP